MKTTTDTTTNENSQDEVKTAVDLTAWDMATSILAGLYKARTKADTEYHEAVARVGGNPFGQGVGATRHLRDTLDDALRSYEADLSQLARSNGHPLPNLKGT